MPEEVSIPVHGGSIRADVGGEESRGTVVFVHGSGSSRHSPRNRYVAEFLQESGFRTVLLDLLTEGEDAHDRRTGEHRFDIALLTTRVLEAMEWLRDQAEPDSVGLFGASTGAAAALRAAAARPAHTGAVVSRGGRPDLAYETLSDVVAPSLLIVGSHDLEVLKLNERALGALNAESSMEIVAGAGHLFEEPGKLDAVSRLAVNWFEDWLGA